MRLAKGELALALAFAALGALWIARAASMTLWDGFAPGSGFMPLGYGVLLVALAAAVVFTAQKMPEEPVGKPLVVLAVTAATIVGLKLVGFAISVFFLLFVLFKVVERLPLVRSGVAAVAVSAVLYLVFKTWLGVPLP